MNRRAFITLLGGAAAWPLSAHAQQPPIPVIGFLSRGLQPELIATFSQGLREADYVEGQNVAFEYRSAEGQDNRLPAMADDLVRLKVALIVATGGGTAPVQAAKAATATIPIVFTIGGDPVRLGLVASLNRPGGNLTGFTQFTAALEPKRLDLLRELVPNAAVIAMLVNPNYPDSETQVSDVTTAARELATQIYVLKASSESGIDAAFATLVEQRIGALLVASDPFFYTQREQLVALAARHAVPAIYQWRDFAVIGGLLSYGTNLSDAWRQAGIYAGKILKGAKPADLPVVQSTKVELVINLNTAKALGLTVPLPLLGRADEVIE